MANNVEDFNKKRLRSSNITVVISIALVLFMVGLLGVILLNASSYADYLKEQLVVNAYFDENYDAKDSIKINKLEKEAVERISELTPVKKVKYISREEANLDAKKTLGIETEVFDENIFPSFVEVSLKKEFIDSTKIDGAMKQIESIPGIVEVKNDSNNQKVYNNLNRVMKWILILSILFLVLAIVLINNSIRLKIYSKRFIIKTMQLVGAKRRFILMPFIKEAIVLGIIASVIALLSVYGVWMYFTSYIEMPFSQDTNHYVWLVALVVGLGIIISVASSIFATWRYLISNTDDLYYN